MEFNLEEFAAQPSLDKFHHCMKEHLNIIAEHFGVSVSKNLRKQVIKSK